MSESIRRGPSTEVPSVEEAREVFGVLMTTPSVHVEERYLEPMIDWLVAETVAGRIPLRVYDKLADGDLSGAGVCGITTVDGSRLLIDVKDMDGRPFLRVLKTPKSNKFKLCDWKRDVVPAGLEDRMGMGFVSPLVLTEEDQPGASGEPEPVE